MCKVIGCVSLESSNLNVLGLNDVRDFRSSSGVLSCCVVVNASCDVFELVGTEDLVLLSCWRYRCLRNREV